MIKKWKKSKKNGQRRRDSAVCRTELLDSNFFFFGPLGPHGAPGPPKKMNFLSTFFYFLYKKYYFFYYGKRVMTYSMVKKTRFRFPTERYLNIVKKGYKDCALNKEYLIKALTGLKWQSYLRKTYLVFLPRYFIYCLKKIIKNGIIFCFLYKIFFAKIFPLCSS